MKSFLEAGATARSVKVQDESGKWYKRGTGTGDTLTADKMADMVAVLIAKYAWDILRPIVAKTKSVAEIYTYWIATPPTKHPRTKAVMQAGDDERVQYVRDQLSVIDLDEIVEQWATKGRANPEYVRQVRALIPRGEYAGDVKLSGPVFALNDYTTARLQQHIVADLGVSEATMQRYKAAHSAFCKRLKALNLLPTNISRDLDLPRLPKYMPTFLEMDQAKLLITDYLDQGSEQQALEALMAGSAIEFGGCAMLKRSDVDVKRRVVMVHPEGTGKNVNRSRPIEVTEDWAWEIFYAYIKEMLPTATVFPSCLHDSGNVNVAFLRRHQAACETVKPRALPETTLHDYRHTFAVTWIDRGVLGGIVINGRTYDLNWLRDQLGHSRTSNQITSRYGVRVKQAEKRQQVDRAATRKVG